MKFIKTTVCSPSWFHQRHGSDETYDLSVYQNDGLYHSSLTNYLPDDIFDLLDDYFDDLGKAYREEIQELYGLGCRELPHFTIVYESSHGSFKVTFNSMIPPFATFVARI